MKIEIGADLLEALRRYAVPFQSRPHPVFAHFPGGDDPVFPFAPASDRGLGILLLTAALHRPGGEAPATRMVAGLFRRHDLGIFRLNRVPFESLAPEVAALAGGGDEDVQRIPGILRSVCDFFYRTGPLGPWLAAAPDWEARVDELGAAIYWMGLRSPLRTKARLFVWLACCAADAARERGHEDTPLPVSSPQAMTFVWPVGDGHMRFWLDIVKPGRARGTRVPAERLAAFAALARAAFPEAPWRLYRPLDDFLAPDGAGGFRCRTAQGGCKSCPLNARCPAAGHFILRAG